MTCNAVIQVLVAWCLLAGLAAAVTHPDHIALRFRGGRVYREALEMHTQLMRDNDIYFNTTANTFEQLLNISDPLGQTFSQRYWVDYSAWNGQNTAILYINGEAPASSSPTGYCAQYGHSKNAILFTLENRYYGESMPSPLTNLTMLRNHLSVDAALEDLRNFMTFVESSNFLNRKMRWLIVGGSYSGALSAWFKQKYPNAVLAAWSSSGVVKAQLNFYDYDGHVGAEIPPVCRESVQNVLSIFNDMWDNETQRPELLAKFNVPSYFLKQDMSYMLADAAAGAVQYGNKWRLCDAIVPQDTMDPLKQYNDMITDLFGSGFTNGCYYSTMCLSNRSMSHFWAGAGYSWIFQTCSQMAYFQVGYYNSVRLSDVSTDYFIAQCRAAFGPTIFPDVYAFNTKYGGLTPDASNVIALQGSDDPWSTTGVRTSLGVNYPAVIAECEGCGHCGDLMTPSASDPLSLQQQRLQIAHFLDIWMSSAPQSYQMILDGNFSFIDNSNNSAAYAIMLNAVQADIRGAIDQSVTVSSIATGSLVVNFELEINSLNAPLVAANIIASSNSTSWLNQTQIAFVSLGGTGTISIRSITEESGGGEPGGNGTCGTGCVIGIVIGCVAVAVLFAVIVNIIRKKRSGESAAPFNAEENSALVE